MSRKSKHRIGKSLPILGLMGCALVVAGTAPVCGGEPTGDDVVDRWLARQAEIRSWSADVVQTRRLKSLVRPLEARGIVYFVPPNRFRWQLGEPPRTVAVRSENELLVAYPRLKQLERYPFGGDVDPAWRQALDLLEVGFPTDADAFYSRYELLDVGRADEVWRFELRPAGEAARRLLEAVRIEVADDDLRLLATELVFPDGSTMRNDFSGHRLDAELDPSLFEIETGADWQVVSPLER